MILPLINGKLETVTTNNVETFWSMLKRGHQGVFHKISPKQLQGYVDEATGHTGKCVIRILMRLWER